MKEQYATKRLLLIPANKSLIEAVTDYYVRNRAFFQAYGQLGEKFTVHFLWKDHTDYLLATGTETACARIGQIIFLLDDGQNTLA